MLQVKRSRQQRYGVAVLAAALALLLTMLLRPLLEPSVFGLFYAAVTLSSWYGGMKPGLLTSALSALAINIFFIEPIYNFSVADTSSLIQLGVFVLVTLIIGSTNASLRTAKQRVEAGLRKLQVSEERLRLSLEAGQMGFWDWNLLTNEVVWSENLEAIHGLKPGSFGGTFTAFQEIVHPDDRASVGQAIARAIEAGSNYSNEFRIFWSDGSIRWMLAKGQAFCHPNGKAVRMIGVAMDITERKQTEAALQESQQLFESFMNHSPVTAFIKDDSGRYVYVNRLMERTFQRTLADWVGKTDFDVFPAPAVRKWRENDVAVLTSGQTLESLETIPHTDGEHYYKSFKFPLPDASGRHLLAGMALDITNQKRLEDELRQSEARFRHLFDSNMIGVIFADLSGSITEANDAFLKMMGYTQEEVLAGHVRWLEMTPPEYGSVDEQAIEEIRQMGVCTPFEKEYIRKDGNRVPVFVGAALLPDSQANCICFVLDLSDRKRAEAALKKREDELSLITDAVPVLISYVDAQQCYRFNNKAYEEWFGHPASTVHGKHLQEVLGEVAYEAIRPYIETVLSGKRVTYESEVPYNNAGTRYIHATYIPQFGKQGQVEGFVALVNDISDRKQAEMEIRQLTETLEQRIVQRTAQLEEANKELESFSYSVSHDLRAPLRHISGFVDLLQKRASAELDETSLRYLKIISQTTKHAGKLIDNLLIFSRMGRTEMRYTTVNLEQLIREVRRDIEQDLNGRVIHWQIGKLPEVWGDAFMLSLVVRNLLENAVKYTANRPQTEITIGSSSNEGEIVFFVRDNGVGFDMRYVNKLFGVFQRLHSDEQFAGNGIGLANVRRIVHRHGGRTWAEGTVDGGATFYFSLPKIEL